ncbi:uncharacterized protein LOC124675239 [Lolium rigidum]|uniref:uncharacterized protein LOC124675239 n=1 Tax=Lolium rigidum TaxID=89674 RepID=UPI001F5C8A86|nr:uncharacterized protein LOC124675239 [Lolium rigidum]
MTAALRYAAKRLGGGVLQRSKTAIVSEEGRRLPTRLFHTPTKATAVDETNTVVSRLSHIQEKKEELYNLVADFERTYKAPFSISWQNSRLLHQLSTQVEPRPSDPYWRMCRRVQRKTSFFIAAGICSAGLSTGAAMAYGLHWLKKNYSKDLEDWWNKQMRRTGAK